MAKRTKYNREANDNPVKMSDLGTPELHQKGGITKKLNDVTGYIVAHRLQRPIDYYFSHDYIEPYHYDAANLLDKDYRRYLILSGHANLLKSSINLEKGRSISTEENHLDFIKGKKRYFACMRLFNPTEFQFIHAVILNDQYLKELKKAPEFRPENLGMLFSLTLNTLRDKLDTIAQFYGVRGW